MDRQVKGILGAKLGMTQVWDNNKVVPVTVVQAGPCVVTQVRTPDRDGYAAVQLAFGAINPRKVILEAIPGPTVDRVVVERWFANKTGLGEGAAKKMAAFYEMLIIADPTETQTVNKKPKSPPIQIKTGKTTSPTITTPKEKVKDVIDPKITGLSQPSIHLDIQIHISPDATAEQIDQVFDSIAKHLYKE